MDDPAVDEGDFRRVRPIGVHRHVHRAVADEFPVLAVHRCVGIHGIFTGIHRLVGICCDWRIIFVHIMDRHRGGMDDPAVDEGDFRRVRPIGVHRHVHRAVADEFPVLAVHRCVGIHGIFTGIHRLIGVRGDWRIVIIHIVDRHRGGPGCPLICESDFRGIRPVGVHIHIIGAGTGQLIIVGVDVYSGIHRIIARIDGLDGVLRNGRAQIIHIVNDHRRGHHGMTVRKGDFGGIRPIGVHIHIIGGGTRHFVFFRAEGHIGVYRIVARVQGLVSIRSDWLIVFIHIMNGHRGGPGHAHIRERDFSGIGPVGIHIHFRAGGAEQRVIPGVDGRIGIHRIVAGVHRLIGIFGDRRPVFIHIMDGHRGGLRRDLGGEGFLGGRGGIGIRRQLLERNIQEIQAGHIPIGVESHDLDRLNKKQVVPRILHELQRRITARLKESIVAGHILNLQCQPLQRRIRRQRQPITVGKTVVGNGHGRIADLRALPAFPLHRDRQILRRQRGGQTGQGQQQQEQGDQQRHAAAGEDTNTFHTNDASFGIHRKNTVYFNCITVF